MCGIDLGVMSNDLPPLAASGLCPNLYDLLWAKNNLLQTRCLYHKCPPVLVPDTIQLVQRNPVAWYFSSLKNGTLQRRTKDMDIGKIAEAFAAKADPDLDVVCTLVEKKKLSSDVAVHYLTAQQLGEDGCRGVVG